ncbi:MAG: hypothetical protein HOL01_19540 [Planctomycetaceae bacterium]|jgi:hypothetical protein|nr:hypothetical protein [Planctomycetaceae bacterium]MBT6484167.1 hypothetical protein [Planctomycetaceae bacterium]MBT6496734.1 hypothetical protein [Planctomycetaceae bacterium]
MIVRQFRVTIPISQTLAAVLAFVAVAGCGGGGTADDKSAAEWAIQHGGTVNIVGSILKVDTVEDLPEESFEVQKIDLNQVDPPITDKDLEGLPASESLVYFGLHSAKVTDKGLEPLLKLSGLKELELSYTEVGDNGLDQLAAMKTLTKLYLYGTSVSDDAVEQFKKKRTDCTVYRD